MDDAMAVVAEVQRAWKAAFEVRDLDALGALYAPQTAFYGSTAAFYDTRDGVRTYFRLLPAAFKGVDYATPHVLDLGADAITATGEVTFHRENEDGTRTALPFRMTQILVRQGGAWLIATHHASPRPPAADGETT